MLRGRLESLKNKHKELDNTINMLYKHSNTSEEITVLKKQKLQIKEEILKIGELNG